VAVAWESESVEPASRARHVRCVDSQVGRGRVEAGIDSMFISDDFMEDSAADKYEYY